MRLFVAMLNILFYAAISDAANVDNGEVLHMEKCTACHTASIYTREKRLVTDIKKLGAQVRFCKDNLGIMWFEEEIGDVVHFLNVKHYHY